MTKHYLVIYTDYGDSCDGLARVLGVYETKEKAKHEMDSDIKFYQRRNHHPMSAEQGVFSPPVFMSLCYSFVLHPKVRQMGIKKYLINQGVVQ